MSSLSVNQNELDDIRENIEQLNKTQQCQLLATLQSMKIPFSENMNGIFLNLSICPPEAIDQIKSMIHFFQSSEENIENSIAQRIEEELDNNVSFTNENKHHDESEDGFIKSICESTDDNIYKPSITDVEHIYHKKKTKPSGLSEDILRKCRELENNQNLGWSNDGKGSVLAELVNQTN